MGSVPAPEPVFTGVAVALVTLFGSDGDLDAPASARLAVELVERGVRAVVVAGSTGEAATLTPEERVELLDAVRGAVPADVPVVAGTGAPSARQAVALTRAAVDHGADAVLTLSPPGSQELSRYYHEVVEVAGGRPVLAYHYPKVSAPGIPVDALGALPVAGLKDSSGEAARLLQELECFGRPLYTGSSALLSFAGPLGCTGAILALANVEPERCIAAFEGDVGAQRSLAAAHEQAHAAFPRSLKEMVAAASGMSPVTRQ